MATPYNDSSRFAPSLGAFAASNPSELVVLASAAQTTTQTQADQDNASARGIVVILNVTVASGTGGLTLEIDGKDPGSGTYYALLTGTSVTTTGQKVYRVYPGLTASANATASDVLPKTWRVKITAGDASSYTYSVGAILLP